MVRFLLKTWPRRTLSSLTLVAGAVLLRLPVAASHSKPKPAPIPVQTLELLGGRTLNFERAFNSEREVRPNRGFWNRVLDVVAGPPEFHSMARPYSVATDSRGRIIVTDPDLAGVHIFDFSAQKYKFLSRYEKDTDPMIAPQCVAVDASDNIYVTDSEVGKIFVFNRDGHYTRALGALRGGEGYFKRPTGIAVDSADGRVYVSDTLRHQIFVLDMQGNVLKKIGKRGTAEGEFNYPTELRLNGLDLLVVDAMNFRVQALTREGEFKFAIGKLGDGTGAMFRPKGIAVDSEGDFYVVDGLWGVVQVFNREGELLYYFGGTGELPGQFHLPAGLFIDASDRIYVADSLNHRVQVYRYHCLHCDRQANGGGTP